MGKDIARRLLLRLLILGLVGAGATWLVLSEAEKNRIPLLAIENDTGLNAHVRVYLSSPTSEIILLDVPAGETKRVTTLYDRLPTFAVVERVSEQERSLGHLVVNGPLPWKSVKLSRLGGAETPRPHAK